MLSPDPFAERIGGIPWVVIAAAALILAAVYVFIPAGEGLEGARWIIVRWAHSAAFVFLAAAALARSKAIAMPLEWAAPLGATGGLVYVVYMVTMLSGG